MKYILDLWLKTMILVVLCFIGYELHNFPKSIDYTSNFQNIENVLNDMNTLDYYNRGKKFK